MAMTKPGTGAEEPSDVKFDANAQFKVELAHDVVQHPEKFAAIFCKAAESQVSIKELIKKEIRSALENDADSIKFLKAIITKHFKDDWRAFVRTTAGQILLMIWTLLVAFISAWLGRVFR